MFCTECGTSNAVDSKYCKECGTRINDGYRTMMLAIEDREAVEDEQSQERLTHLLDMAFWHNEAGNLDAAVLAAEAALAVHPQCTTAHSLLGTLYEKKGDDARAIEHFEAVVRLNPDSIADAAKLDQLRRGVHVRAVTPPPGYKWLPPALVGLNWAALRGKWVALGPRLVSGQAGTGRWGRIGPVVPASAAGVLVLFGGLAAFQQNRTAVRPTPPVRGTAAPPRSALSAYGGAVSAMVGADPSPIALPRVTGSPAIATISPKASALAPDPFSETLSPGAHTTPLVLPSPRRTAAARVPSFRAARRSVAPSLPPLSLRAVPLPGGGGVAPAPVVVPSAAASYVPQHTVVVSNFGGNGGAVPMQTSYTPPPDSSGGGGAPGGMASHIKITINDSPSAPSSGNITISDHADPARSVNRASRANGGGGSSDGDAYQQAALSLQQQGDFRRARTAYQQAIHAYKAQIAAGHAADDASQGLAASQTGLQICEQSQH